MHFLFESLLLTVFRSVTQLIPSNSASINPWMFKRYWKTRRMSRSNWRWLCRTARLLWCSSNNSGRPSATSNWRCSADIRPSSASNFTSDWATVNSNWVNSTKPEQPTASLPTVWPEAIYFRIKSTSGAIASTAIYPSWRRKWSVQHPKSKPNYLNYWMDHTNSFRPLPHLLLSHPIQKPEDVSKPTRPFYPEKFW